LHSYCKNIYHYGIAWNPSDMEQRTGRIDRIDSLAYRKIKEIAEDDVPEIPFDRKLQVFYPYLADTLEVNQMSNLFIGMNRFIDIFYNDLSVKIEKNSKAQLDVLVENILPQRNGLLTSRYDVDSFESMHEIEVEFQLKEIKGITFDDLKSKLSDIYKFLENKKHHLAPEIDLNILRIRGTLNIRKNRQGPFMISIEQSEQLYQFIFKMESCLGRISVMGSQASRQRLLAIFGKIFEKKGWSLKPVERNSYIWLHTTTAININTEEVFDNLLSLVHLTDRIEACLSSKDEAIASFD
jgi:hypothetical protein